MAKCAWRSLVPMLEEMGVLSRIDKNALGRYCVTWARWKKAEQFLEKHGDTYPVKHYGKDGIERVIGFRSYPQVKAAHILAMQLLRLEQEFGLTPSARTRIRIEEAASADPLGDFLREQEQVGSG